MCPMRRGRGPDCTPAVHSFARAGDRTGELGATTGFGRSATVGSVGRDRLLPDYTSVCSAISSASSTSIPRYLTELTEQTRDAVNTWITAAHLKPEQFLFPSRVAASPQLSTRRGAASRESLRHRGKRCGKQCSNGTQEVPAFDSVYARMPQGQRGNNRTFSRSQRETFG